MSSAYSNLNLGVGSPSLPVRAPISANGGIVDRFSDLWLGYSLRGLRNNAADVIEVRRDRDSDGSTNERTFRAFEMDEIQDWVNGKQEATLPADVAAANGAFGLRRLKESYGEKVLLEGFSSFPASTYQDSPLNPTTPYFPDNSPCGSGVLTVSHIIVGDPTYIRFIRGSDIVKQSERREPSAIDMSVSRATNADDERNHTLFRFTGIEPLKRYKITGKVFNDFSDQDPTFMQLNFGSGVQEPFTENIRSGIPQPFELIGSVPQGENQFELGVMGAFGRGGTASIVISEFKVVELQPCIHIRRTSDEAEVDVFFDENGRVSESSQILNIAEETDSIDVSATATTLGEFIAGTDAKVVTWYDQSGEGNHIVQTTSSSQPVIAQNGVLLDHVLFEGGSQFFSPTTISPAVSEPFTVASVIAKTSTSGGGVYGLNSTCFGNFSTSHQIGKGGQTLSYTSDSDTDTYYLRFDTFKDGDDSTLEVNENTPASSSLPAESMNEISVGANNSSSGFPFRGKIKEIIFYPSDQGTNSFKIRSNINNYHGIYDGEIGNGFVVTWFDQGSAARNLVNPVESRQPTIVESGSYLGFIRFSQQKELNTASLPAIGAVDRTVFQVIKSNDNSSPFNLIWSESGFAMFDSFDIGAYESFAGSGAMKGDPLTPDQFNQIETKVQNNAGTIKVNGDSYATSSLVSNSQWQIVYIGSGYRFGLPSDYDLKEWVTLINVNLSQISHISNDEINFFQTPSS